MHCPFCLSLKLKVVEKRNLENLQAIRRRRECIACGKRFTTYERIELIGLQVMKKDGRREAFDRQKLLSGIQKACEKRPIRTEQIDQLVSEIEAELRNLGEKEVPTQKLGGLVMDRLKSLDKVAYIRFASVYREFTDLRSFEQELKTLKKAGTTRQSK